MGHVIYIVFDASKLSKVGMTSDIDSRMAVYRTTNPSCELAAILNVPTLEAAREIEHLTHRILHHGCDGKEWFHYSVDNCIYALCEAAEAWNVLMRQRQKICGHDEWKSELSPIVDIEIERYETSPCPTQDEIYEQLLMRFVRLLEQKTPEERSAMAKRLAANVKIDTANARYTRDWWGEFVDERDEMQRHEFLERGMEP